jgi:hypothetical protein
VKYGCWYNNAKLQDEIWKLRKEAAKKVGLWWCGDSFGHASCPASF